MELEWFFLNAAFFELRRKERRMREKRRTENRRRRPLLLPSIHSLDVQQGKEDRGSNRDRDGGGGRPFLFSFPLSLTYFQQKSLFFINLPELPQFFGLLSIVLPWRYSEQRLTSRQKVGLLSVLPYVEKLGEVERLLQLLFLSINKVFKNGLNNSCLVHNKRRSIFLKVFMC